VRLGEGVKKLGSGPIDVDTAGAEQREDASEGRSEPEVDPWICAITGSMLGRGFARSKDTHHLINRWLIRARE
jgi:hypothetical protein